MKRKEVVRPNIDHVDLIGRHGDELTAFEIMQQTGLSKNTVFKIQRMIKDAKESRLEIPAKCQDNTRQLYEYIKIQYDPACRVKPQPPERYIIAPEKWQKDFERGMEEQSYFMILCALKDIEAKLDRLLQGDQALKFRGHQIGIDDL